MLEKQMCADCGGGQELNARSEFRQSSVGTVLYILVLMIKTEEFEVWNIMKQILNKNFKSIRLKKQAALAAIRTVESAVRFVLKSALGVNWRQRRAIQGERCAEEKPRGLYTWLVCTTIRASLESLLNKNLWRESPKVLSK